MMNQKTNRTLFIGLGAGRTGTASLARLINNQRNALCFHELNPTCAHFSDNFAPIKNTINEFQEILNGGNRQLLTLDYTRKVSVNRYEQLKAMSEITLLGDIAYYYLTYVEAINALNPNVKFLCLYRDKTSNVDSWIKQTTFMRWPSLWLADRLHALIMRQPFYKERNFWQEHDGSKWRHDLVWDKTIPKFQAKTKRHAIEMYWDYYNEETSRLASILPRHFKVIDVKLLNTLDGQKEVLEFLGIASNHMQLLDDCHIHKSHI